MKRSALDAMPHAVEIERCWLLTSLPKLPDSALSLRISQGYLPRREHPDDLIGRLRKTKTPDGSTIYHHTIKTGRGLVRQEHERELSKGEFKKHWPRTAALRVKKWRHEVRVDELLWQIDEFDQPAGLVLAEVELPTEDTQVSIPKWLNEVIDREVTEEKQFTNRQIAKRLREAASLS